jgi:HNH endonuclease
MSSPNLCLCGCGSEAPRWKFTQRTLGRIKGEPARYLPHHYKPTPERNARLSKSLMGHSTSDETRHKMSEAAKARRYDRIKQNGYILVLAPDHPYANSHGHVLEHRLVVEKVLGRHLLPSEHVHHINRDKTDNRPENLQVLSPSEHMRIHKREWLETGRCAK